MVSEVDGLVITEDATVFTGDDIMEDAVVRTEVETTGEETCNAGVVNGIVIIPGTKGENSADCSDVDILDGATATV